MIYIDVPQVAYKTWCIEYVVRNDDGTRDHLLEYELEEDLRKTLSRYPYSKDNPHVR